MTNMGEPGDRAGEADADNLGDESVQREATDRATDEDGVHRVPPPTGGMSVRRFREIADARSAGNQIDTSAEEDAEFQRFQKGMGKLADNVGAMLGRNLGPKIQTSVPDLFPQPKPLAWDIPKAEPPRHQLEQLEELRRTNQLLEERNAKSEERAARAEADSKRNRAEAKRANKRAIRATWLSAIVGAVVGAAIGAVVAIAIAYPQLTPWGHQAAVTQSPEVSTTTPVVQTPPASPQDTAGPQEKTATAVPPTP